MGPMAKVRPNARGWFGPEGEFEASRRQETPWTFDSKLELGYVHASPLYTGVGTYIIAGRREAIDRNKATIAETLGLRRALVYDEQRFYLGEFDGQEFVRTRWSLVAGRPTPPGLDHFATDMKPDRDGQNL